MLYGNLMLNELISACVKAMRRRVCFSAEFLVPAFLFFVFSVCWSAAQAQSAYRVLNEPALMAKTPDQDLLEAVALAGNRLVAVGEHGIIIYSDDNGQSWRQAAVPVDVTFTTVAFATPQDGWVGGGLGVILHTTDGGVTWKLQITGVQVNQLILAATDQFATSHPTDPNVPRALRRANFFTQAGADKPFLSVLAFDADNAQMFGAYRMCIKTKDAGASWQDCSLDIPDPISHNLYDAMQSGSSIYVAGESGSVFRSDDQGQTFSALTVPADDTLLGILVTPAHALLAYGVAGGLYRSTDHGQTWTAETIGSQSNLTAGIILKSGTILLLSVTGTVHVSSDDGVSFRALPTSEGMALFGAVQAQNGDVLLVGSGGVRVLPLSSLSQNF
jgi:photosystem II stability/assembly factor-like uncharacterized protein